MPPRVAVIVLNWNGGDDTRACLESLADLVYADKVVAVVDNGSSDGSPAALRAAFPDVEIVETGANLGYAGGNNIGLQYARERAAKYVLLLNNDTEVAPDCLARLVDAAEADPSAGFFGPTIFYHHCPEVIWSAGGRIDLERGRTAMLGLGERSEPAASVSVRDVDFVSGCAVLVRLDMIARVGALDERFFCYYEDSEWALRASRAGYRSVHVSGAHVWHKLQPEAREEAPYVQYYMTRNRLLFLRLAGAPWRAWLRVLVLEEGRTLLSWSLRPKWRHRGSQRRARCRALADFVRGRWGRAPVAVAG